MSGSAVGLVAPGTALLGRLTWHRIGAPSCAGGNAIRTCPHYQQGKEDHYDNQQSEVFVRHHEHMLTLEHRVICKVQTDRALVRRQCAFEHERRWLHLTQFFWCYENPFRWFHGHGFAGWAECFVFAHAHIMRREFAGWGSYSRINPLSPVVCWSKRPAQPSALCRAGEVNEPLARPFLDPSEAEVTVSPVFLSVKPFCPCAALK